MTDDSKLVDAYKSMYEHHQKDADGKVIEHDDKEQLDELAPLAAIPAVMKGVGTAMKVASAVSTAKDVADTLKPKPKRGGTANNLEHVETEMDMVEAKVDKKLPSGPFFGGAKERAEARNQRKFGKKDSGIDVPYKRGNKYNPMSSPGGSTEYFSAERGKETAAKRGVKKVKGVKEDVAITHLDGSTTEIVDVVTPQPLGNPDENLADRLWDQVAANLTTLGEMAGVRYQVSPVEELQEKKKKKGKKLDPVGKEDEDIDNDGDVDDSDSYLKKRREAIGKAMKKEEVEVETELDERACWDSHKKVGMKMKGGKLVNDCRPKNESFNVKSPVIFSKPEEKVEEPISEETIEKHASSILKAHKSIQK